MYLPFTVRVSFLKIRGGGVHTWKYMFNNEEYTNETNNTQMKSSWGYVLKNTQVQLLITTSGNRQGVSYNGSDSISF